ncbi:MAG: AAA family ATPase [Planctomycetales bacterium]|nr:AAA family ATPase [Planctomycetales bacterium]
MLIQEVKIESVRSINTCHWSIPRDKAKGWHVVIGDNGSGKTTFLRSIALALIGKLDAGGLRQSWSDWLTRGAKEGKIALRVSRNRDTDLVAASDSNSLGDPPQFGLKFARTERSEPQVGLEQLASDIDPHRHVWYGGQGWFCASYGPFRRFAGNDPRDEKLYHSMPRLARHLSLFDERIALTESLEWLKNLKFAKLEGRSDHNLFDDLVRFVNDSDFLPANVRLHDVSSRGVTFRDANDVDVDVMELSDGYRSILSMTFELVRQMSLSFEADALFDPQNGGTVTPEGVVLIDEVDAHLHPSWQRTVGRWFCKHFPNVQFIVSSHSPLVCQSASEGSIFVLPRSGSRGEGRMLEGDEFHRLVYGNILDAYGTEAFGSETAATRSEPSRKLHSRLAELNNKEIMKGLSTEERTEQVKLRAILPSAASSMG